MSRLDLSLAAAALTACLSLLPGTASAQAINSGINPNISANAEIGGQPGIVNTPRICGVHIKCETPKSKQSSGEQQPGSARRR